MSTETLDWQDIISGWSFTCGGDEPPEGLAESIIPAVTREISGAYEITTISFGFSRTAPYYQQKFTAAFSCNIKYSANLYSVRVSSDDTATVNIGEISASSTLHNPSEDETKQWISSPSDSLSLSGNYETIGGPYSLNVTIILKRSLRKLHIGFLYAPPNAGNAGLTENYPISERRKIGVGESLKIWIRSKDDESLELEGPSSVRLEFADGSVLTITPPTAGNIEILGDRFYVDGDVVLLAMFADGEVLKDFISVVCPEFQIGEEIIDERNAFYETVSKLDSGEKVTVRAEVGMTTKYKVVVHPTDVSFAGARFWECIGERSATGIFSGMSGTVHEPGTELMALKKENDWEDTVGFGIFEFPYDFFNSKDFLDAEEGAILGTLTWKIPVRWTVASEEELVEIEKTENDERDYKKEISPKSVQVATCKKIKLVSVDSDGVLWSGTGLSISVKKDFCPGQSSE